MNPFLRSLRAGLLGHTAFQNILSEASNTTVAPETQSKCIENCTYLGETTVEETLYRAILENRIDRFSVEIDPETASVVFAARKGDRAYQYSVSQDELRQAKFPDSVLSLAWDEVLAAFPKPSGE